MPNPLPPNPYSPLLLPTPPTETLVTHTRPSGHRQDRDLSLPGVPPSSAERRTSASVRAIQRGGRPADREDSHDR
jgi:hypothetical protein